MKSAEEILDEHFKDVLADRKKGYVDDYCFPEIEAAMKAYARQAIERCAATEGSAKSRIEVYHYRSQRKKVKEIKYETFDPEKITEKK